MTGDPLTAALPDGGEALPDGGEAAPHGGEAAPDGSEAARLGRRVAAELAAQLALPLAPALYLVATPIGHLADITLRALAVLLRADDVYCEDTRQSHKLMARYGIERRLQRYHEHNAEHERPRILSGLAAGRSVALISDAGTPLISDPGFKLVRAAVADGHRVLAIPGPSATLAALSVSGMPTDCFHFAGFLPPKSAARRARAQQLAGVQGSLIVFEAANRIADTLHDLADVLGARQAAVARELTKLHEEVRRGVLPELAAWATSQTLKGEIVLVIGPPLPLEICEADIVTALQQQPDGTSVRDAASAVSMRLGVSRSRVYDLAVALRDDRSAHEDGSSGT